MKKFKVVQDDELCRLVLGCKKNDLYEVERGITTQGLAQILGVNPATKVIVVDEQQFIRRI
jgi:hypothetical protein